MSYRNNSNIDEWILYPGINKPQVATLSNPDVDDDFIMCKQS